MLQDDITRKRLVQTLRGLLTLGDPKEVQETWLKSAEMLKATLNLRQECLRHG